jgi:hypothetical protein
MTPADMRLEHLPSAKAVLARKNLARSAVGIWFAVMGIFEIIGGLLLRRALRTGALTPA